jgi:hypothetical protein
MGEGPGGEQWTSGLLWGEHVKTDGRLEKRIRPAATALL